MLSGNTLLRPLVNWINRRPTKPDVTEAQYLVHASCRPQDLSAVCDLLDATLDDANYPIRQVALLQASPLVVSATWSVEATS